MKRLLRFLALTGVFSVATLVMMKLLVGDWYLKEVMGAVLIVIVIVLPSIVDWFGGEKSYRSPNNRC